ncbi:lysophospholipid acyltransferase family protein [Phenylobacterium sp.]|uniref:lysophospholipid acyltransferase family protein n=1 Tax=Phenylobacterium sp. TaxID=1871053 RepID=UPI0035B0A2AE
MADRRPSLAQDLLWRLEGFAYDLFTTFVRTLPLDTASDIGSWLLRRLGPLTSSHRIARINLKIAFPDAPEDEIERLLDDQWGQLGRWLMEFPVLDRIIADPERVEVVGAERLAQIARDREPVVFVSGHFSSFEIMPAAILHAGVTCQITYRATNNPYVDERIKAARRRYGVTLFAPKGGDGARELLEALGRGESVALMNDQKFNGGVAAPLFGVMCHTAPGPTRLALRFNAVLQPMSVQRKDKARFRVVAHEPIHLARTGDRTADIEAGVRQVNAFIEERVRERPAEWWWVHKRWPAEVYKKAG